jgi:uncharacterized protein YqfA (UPF0365 family)
MSIKLKENEIEALQGFQKRTQDVITDLGKIELQMSELEDVKAKVKEGMAKVVEEQNEFFKTLEESYGKGQINVSTFEFIPQEEPAVETVEEPTTEAK